jgi:MFS family permease
MFQQKFNMNLQESGVIITFPDIVFIIMGGFFGFFVDKHGKRGSIITIGFGMLFVSHLIFFNLNACEDTLEKDKCYEGILPMSLVGLANMLIQITLYPAVNYIVKERYFGTAYGILETACNLGMILGSVIVGLILNIANGKEDQATDLL